MSYRRRLNRIAAIATAAMTGITSKPGVFVPPPVLFPPVVLPPVVLPPVVPPVPGVNGSFEFGAQSPHHSFVVWSPNVVYSAAHPQSSTVDRVTHERQETALSVLPEIVTLPVRRNSLLLVRCRNASTCPVHTMTYIYDAISGCYTISPVTILFQMFEWFLTTFQSQCYFICHSPYRRFHVISMFGLFATFPAHDQVVPAYDQCHTSPVPSEILVAAAVKHEPRSINKLIITIP